MSHPDWVVKHKNSKTETRKVTVRINNHIIFCVNSQNKNQENQVNPINQGSDN